MPKITEARISQVYIREIEPRKWRASWTDPLTRKHVRRVLPVTSFRDAKKQAEEINRELASGKGFGGRLRGSTGHGVADAILEAVKHSGANERTRKDYINRGNAFIGYLSEKVEGVKSWGEVTEAILQNYIEHCRKEGLAHDSLRLRLYVLRMTSRYMADTYPQSYRDVAGRIRLKRHAPTKAELEAEDSILNPEQIRSFLAWLKENDPMVYVWAVLQGLCGLRLYEAAYLRECDHDPKAGTVTITESEAHKPKNRPSYRTIPLPPVANQALKDWTLGLKVRHPKGFLFFPAGIGNGGRENAKSPEARAGVYTPAKVSAICATALSLKGRGKPKLPNAFTPRKLRSSFVTAVREAGADFEVLQRYIGHQPRSILAAHYDRIGFDRLKIIASLAQDLHSAVGFFTKNSKLKKSDPLH